MLTSQKPEDIETLAARCDEVAVLLRRLRGDMEGEGPRELEINVGKAGSFLDYLKDWAEAAHRKHRAIRKREAKRLAVESARKKRHETETRRASGRSRK
ncbi:MAG TPA: hypothetical protein VG826_04145 [Pirellulales bacterium]|nr:hypothetical protein [Pirellulales bacterium]